MLGCFVREAPVNALIPGTSWKGLGNFIGSALRPYKGSGLSQSQPLTSWLPFLRIWDAGSESLSTANVCGSPWPNESPEACGCDSAGVHRVWTLIRLLWEGRAVECMAHYLLSLSKSVPFGGQTGCPYQLSSFPGQLSPVFLGACFPSDTVYWGFFFLIFIFFSFLHRMRTWRKNFRICFLKKISRCLYPIPQPRYFQMMVVKCRLSFKERAHEQDWWAQKVSLVAVA